MEHFNRKFLLYSEDSAEANEWIAYLHRAGVLESSLEMQNKNIVNKLQDKSYNACILLAGKSSFEFMNTILFAIKSNHLASLVPVVVVAPGSSPAEVYEYYDMGANYVLYTQNRPQGAKELCHILENLLVLLDKYLMGQDKRFLR